MKKLVKNIAMFSALAIAVSSCAVIRPGEIGFKQRLGKLVGDPTTQGLKGYNPFISTVIRMNVRTVEVVNSLILPTREGLNVQADIALLYHVDPAKAQEIYTKFGRNYQEVIVLSNFRATAREISARYETKELYATERQKVENAIKDELVAHISQYGFIVDAVLLKDFVLPTQMVQAIQDKVNAEQSALKMNYIIQQQKKEAERLIIEAEAIKKAQDIINSSLTDKLLQYNNIEMLKSLVNSPNAKIIITDGKTVPMITTDGK
jgi:regulator of protease activity HflC (stomatin/prohibitin superfamily)